MSPPVVTDAICLTVQKFSETSKIAVLYTRLWGRISVIAKGANRPKSQYAGHLEPLSVAECVIYKKPTERLQLLASCRATQPWLPLTTSLERAAYAFAVCEFLYRHTYEGQDGELFSLAVETLGNLSQLPDTETARQFWGFLLAALEYLGFRPVFDHCDRCGSRPEPGKKVMFDTAAGKIICRQCRRDEGRPRILSPDALNELIIRQTQPILEDNEAVLPPGALDEIAASVSDFAAYHLGGGRLRSLDFAYRMAATG
jgi:DNA repair protein RecO (recombination protein O)